MSDENAIEVLVVGVPQAGTTALLMLALNVCDMKPIQTGQVRISMRPSLLDFIKTKEFPLNHFMEKRMISMCMLPQSPSVSCGQASMPVIKKLKLFAVTGLLSLLAACGGGGGGCNQAFGLVANCSSSDSANTAPIAKAGTTQNVITGSLVTLDGSSSSDAENNPLTFKWTLVAAPAGSTASLVGPTSAKPTFTADVSGTYLVSLVVNDGKVDSAMSTVTVTAANLNVAPVANAGSAQSVVTGSQVTLDGSSSSDANRDLLTYKWTLLAKPVGSLATLSSATDVKPKFTADVAGAYIFTLVVNDGRLSSTVDAAATVTITASAVNAAPVSNAGINQSVVVGTAVTLDGSASGDANLDPLTYKWTLVVKPATSVAALSSATAVRPTFTADLAGVYVASLVVNDGKLDSALATVTVTASAVNAAPVANAGTNQNVVTASVVTLNGTGSTDANFDPLTYKWAFGAKPAGSTATLSSATAASPTFTADLAGVYVATLIVNDGKLDSAVAVVTITAAAPNVAPVANAGPTQTVTRTAGTVTVTLNGTASSDANNDVLTYRWLLSSQPVGSAAALSSTTATQPTFAATVAGVYVATLIVNDGKVDSVPSTVVINVL